MLTDTVSDDVVVGPVLKKKPELIEIVSSDESDTKCEKKELEKKRKKNINY